MQLKVLMDDRTQRRRCRPLLTWSAFLVIALSGCQSAAQSRPANDRQAVPEQTPAPTFESGSRRYRECNAAAGDDTRAQGRCLDEELAYRQRGLDSLYQRWATKLDAAPREALHAEHHEWQQETDRLCASATGTPPVDQICQLNRILARYSVLSYRLSNAPAEYLAEDTPDAHGAMEMRLGDALITMTSDGCVASAIAGGLNCSNVQLQLSTSTLHRQTFSLAGIWLPRTVRRDHPARTGFRGSLRAGFVKGRHGIILSDINADGHEDLMVWTGRDGSHNEPSFTYYLYDAQTRRLIENTALATLMEGHSLSRIVDGRLFAWYRSPPCDRGEKWIEVRGNTPKIVEHKNYNTCEDQDP